MSFHFQLNGLMRLRVSSAKSKTDDDNDLIIIMKQGLCGGVIKHGVTFFGEKLGNEVERNLQRDSVHADALIVMGTSLSV
jgi:NAD-dependent SIR2 family protein deacetylase